MLTTVMNEITKSKSASIGLTKRHNLAIMTAALMVASKADKQDAK